MRSAKRQPDQPVQGHSAVPSLRDDVDIVSVDEVARRLDVPKSTLYGWRYKGKGPRGHRVGKHLRYRWSEVLRWLDNQE